jgi:hypothetical protein
MQAVSGVAAQVPSNAGLPRRPMLMADDQIDPQQIDAVRRSDQVQRGDQPTTRISMHGNPLTIGHLSDNGD